jgi:hypothetical protein
MPYVTYICLTTTFINNDEPTFAIRRRTMRRTDFTKEQVTAIMMEAGGSFETSVHAYQTTGVTSQNVLAVGMPHFTSFLSSPMAVFVSR